MIELGSHTPGPWNATKPHYCDIQKEMRCQVENDMQMIGEVYECDNFDETIANARLMAAAPELLNVVMELLSHKLSDKDGNYVCWVGETLFMQAEAAVEKCLASQ